ncbi:MULTISPECIES: hypothetical protein [Bacillus cereus group]|uniref:hypothetical protein n=1 Tax=Bacillus cereus group TaxID=86661 RepID=UPI00123A388F|nr:MULTISPECIES: hypothetical protein [Bacillus cereus group]KAA6466190.1 hypothetical protein DX930_12410 [Bacillus cereus]KAB2415184.1 hypothetical protein F8169_17210 [Bacillus cereus]KAB2436460.1 hypothetical protein F8166_11695 [Bacillus cereus]KAB2463209.1 hypothetical protein F8164_15175 [Bacillus cereus]MCU5596812.1 glutathione S-transferase C-terminal domain-containing protein [Bacillus wiedmannii]
MEIEAINDPLQKYLISFSKLHMLGYLKDDLPESLLSEINLLLDSYHLESLSILRSTFKTEERTTNEIESRLEELRRELQKLESLKEKVNGIGSDYLDYLDYAQSSHVTNREFEFGQIELESEISSLASLVMLLSLLESTLFLLTRKLIENDSNLPKMHDVMNRSDNGIVKYLKYFEKYLEQQEQPFIVGTKKYDTLMFWLKIRNNIVHSNNIANEEIEKVSKRLNIDISVDVLTKKMKFKYEHVQGLGKLCGEILNDCIEKGLYSYFKIEDD